MRVKLYFIAVILFITTCFSVKADEGMWLVNLISKNYEDMKKQGFKLSPEDIYDINNVSLKDAIIWFGGYCTGTIISSNGLLITNHHCAYESISKLSTLEDNILKNGWYASSLEEEKPVKGLWVGILKEVRDVTPIIEKKLKNVSSNKYPSELQKAKLEIIQQAEKENYHYQAYVKDIFGSSQYILILIEKFNDIRLVGAPPEALGKFGGDKDNWVWPRHTADFSLFRIYADNSNQGFTYSQSNRPYKPKKPVKISLEGYKEKSFSLIMGYPGTTDRYITSFEADFQNKKIYPAIVNLRNISMDAWQKQMSKSDKAKLKFSNIYGMISNYEKFYRGLIEGVNKFKIVEKLKQREKELFRWEQRSQNTSNYKAVFTKWDDLQQKYSDIIIWKTYFEETVMGSPVLRMAMKFIPIAQVFKDKDYNLANLMVNSINTNDLFNDFNYDADQEILPALMLEFWKNTDYEQLPKILDSITEEYGDDAFEAFQNYTHEAFLNSIFTSKERYTKFLQSSNVSRERTLMNDPIYLLVEGFLEKYESDIMPQYKKYKTMVKDYRSEYIWGLQLQNPTKLFYPDANLTPRVTYGTVKSYEPTDGIEYNYFTTSDGIVEKNLSKDSNYVLPDTILQKLQVANTSKYIDQDGSLHVCFITNNDITGGNSGSPILNDKLELIGVAFDGNWESIPGMLYFNEKYNRAIGVDIRFVLWCIDNLAGASRIVQEIIYDK